MTFVDPLGLNPTIALPGDYADLEWANFWMNNPERNNVQDPLPKVRDVKAIKLDDRVYISRNAMIAGLLIAETDPSADSLTYSEGSLIHTAKNCYLFWDVYNNKYRQED